jgi:hypothetical protein
MQPGDPMTPGLCFDNHKRLLSNAE